MTDEPANIVATTEVDRLKSELEAYRQREVAELRSALAIANARLVQAQRDIAAWRDEAQRISSQAKLVAAEADRRESLLRTQLMAKANVLAERTV
jgi:predicted  nucleic acid-binding Zn-ribbon protein